MESRQLSLYTLNQTGEFIKAQVTSTRQEKRGRVLLDESNQALKLLQKLTQTDFPEQKLIINDSGWIEQKR
jgi:hypothetical protein